MDVELSFETEGDVWNYLTGDDGEYVVFEDGTGFEVIFFIADDKKHVYVYSEVLGGTISSSPTRSDTPMDDMDVKYVG